MNFKDKKSVKGYFWKLRDYDKRLALTIYQKNSVSELVSRLLAMKNIHFNSVENYLNPKLRNLLKNPYHLCDMDKAVKTIYDAIIKKKHICIYGDYDVDGATSTALMIKFFKAINVNTIFYIPDRMDEGYGLSIDAVKFLKKKGVDLIITVDCGISCHEAVDYANELGINVVITDHHLGSNKLPNAKAVVNPNRLDEESEYKYLAGVGVAFMVCIAINSYLRESKYYKINKINEPNLLVYLDLVALGTICDVMPLVGINRALVKQGLEVFKKRKNVGLAALADQVKIEEINDTYHLGYMIGPRINACGRVGNVNIGSKLLSCDDINEARILAKELDDFNTERQTIEKNILNKAVEKIETKGLASENFIFLIGESWHEGVIGIIASRLKDRYGKPTFIISSNGKEGKASCRSIDSSIDIGSVIIEAKEKKLLLTGGGHAMAGGFTFEINKTEELKNFIKNRLNSKIEKFLSINEKEYDLCLDCNDISLKLVQDIELIGPYGAGNHKPKIMIENVSIVNIKPFGKSEEHLRLIVVSNNKYKPTSLIVNVFRVKKEDAIYQIIMKRKKSYNLIGTMSLNHWMGVDSIQFVLEDMICNE